MQTRQLLLFLLLGFFGQSCVSPQKMVEYGDYDQAVATAVRRLAGKKQKKAQLVRALEEGFAKATDRDMRTAEALRRENRPENWPRINDIYQRIARRQSLVEPLLPLIDQEGFKADFRFVRLDDLLRESKEKSAAYHYERAQELLRLARNGDKSAAREAYRELEQISEYFRDYRDRRKLMNLARDLGTIHILVNVRNSSRAILPADFNALLTRMGVADLNSTWRTYYTSPVAGITFDYQVVMNIQQVEVSPGLIKEREFEETGEIEDGFEYVLDERGNVRKDSLGNDVKVPRYVPIRAWVLETLQQKSATVAGELEIIDARNRQVLQIRPFAADAVFENYAATFRGDERALSRDTRRRLGNRPLPFPADADLLLQAAERLKPVLKSRIAEARVFS